MVLEKDVPVPVGDATTNVNNLQEPLSNEIKGDWVRPVVPPLKLAKEPFQLRCALQGAIQSILGLTVVSYVALQSGLLLGFMDLISSLESMCGSTVALTLIWTVQFGIVFWGLGGLMMLPAVFPHWFPVTIANFKIQPVELLDTKKRAVFWSRAMPTIIMNFFLAAFLFGPAVEKSFDPRLWSRSGLEDVHLLTLFYQACVFIATTETVFYYSHALLHVVPYLYRTIHKKHHEWTAPVSWIAIYSHPVEHFLSNMIPIFAGCWLGGTHVSVACCFTSVGVLHTMGVHSGFWICDDHGLHDMHHETFTTNYGVIGFLDILHGTSRKPRQINAS